MSDHIVIDNGTLEEIASSKGAHLENLGDGRWYLAFQHGDGSETVVRFTSRDLRTPTIEQREPRQGGRAVSVPPLPSSTVATWGPEDLGEQLSKWQVEPVTEFEPSARPTRARPANARRKG